MHGSLDAMHPASGVRLKKVLYRLIMMFVCLLFETANVFSQLVLVCLMGRVTALGCHGGSLVAGVSCCWWSVVYKAEVKVDDILIEMGRGGGVLMMLEGYRGHRRSVGTFVFMQPSKFKQVTGFHSDHRRDRASVER